MTGKRVKTNAHDNVWWSCLPVIECHVHLAFDVVGTISGRVTAAAAAAGII
jgi:hypothetical protein